MIEELKIIVDAFQGASTYALVAYIGYLLHGLLKIAIIVFPTAATVKFIASKVFVEEKSEDSKNK